MYSKQLHHSTGLRRQGCGQCEACGRADCGACRYCLDKKKFGGKDHLKQRCTQRRCKKLRCKTFQTNKHKSSENLTVSNRNSYKSNANAFTCTLKFICNSSLFIMGSRAVQHHTTLSIPLMWLNECIQFTKWL